MNSTGMPNVFYFDHFGQPVFAQTLAQRSDLRFIGLQHRQSGDEVDAVLSTAHVYQVTSGVNDVPAEFLVAPELLTRTPELLLVSTIGAGYDTVDVDACTQRGILVV